MSSGEPDPGVTADRIRDAAVAELLAVGQAAFAMDSVAKRAFYSVGTVYNRWADRDALLADIAVTRIAPAIADGLGTLDSRGESITWLLDEGQEQIMLAGEIMLAGHASAVLEPVGVDLWQSLRKALELSLPESMAWYVAMYALGSALLRAIDVEGPQPPTGRVMWLVEASQSSSGITRALPSAPTLVPLDVPRVPEPHASDAVGASLIEAAQILLAERGAAGTSTRDIAAGAGVTTGALYRRYDGKSGLLADVLLAQLQPDRYAWTWDLVDALAGEDPFSDAAHVIADRMIEAASDQAAQRVLLQVGVAARNDPALREQIADRIRVAHGARVEMAGAFAASGLLRDDVSPEVLAWGFQAIPVGVRATMPLGIALDADMVGQSMEALLRAAARQG